jgi:hypothetical protein
MRDLPSGAALLGLARDVLLEELLPLLPEDRRLDARLVAAAMAVAGREAQAGDAPTAEIGAELAAFYHANPHPNPPPLAGEGDDLRRFARDLRVGAFENAAQGRVARALMWRLTIAKLRESNPRFLAANGFA